MNPSTINAEVIPGTKDDIYNSATAIVILRFGTVEIARWTTAEANALLESVDRVENLERFIADKLRHIMHDHAA